jgi:hypothetical protein
MPRIVTAAVSNRLNPSKLREGPHFLLACQKLNTHVLMLRIGAVSGNERMPAAHETTKSVHFGAGAFTPLQDVEKEKAAPSTWRPEFAERRSGAARAHCSHRPAGPERATANKPRWRGKNVRCASAICRADPGPLGATRREKGDASLRYHCLELLPDIFGGTSAHALGVTSHFQQCSQPGRIRDAHPAQNGTLPAQPATVHGSRSGRECSRAAR